MEDNEKYFIRLHGKEIEVSEDVYYEMYDRDEEYALQRRFYHISQKYIMRQSRISFLLHFVQSTKLHDALRHCFTSA